jgi:hypothetical protein
MPPKVQRFKSIKHAACADAKHDFNKKGKPFNAKRVADPNKPGLFDVLTGIPEGEGAIKGIPTGREGEIKPDTLRSEDAMLEEIFKETAFEYEGKSDAIGNDNRKPFVKRLIEAMGPSYEDKPITFKGINGDEKYMLKILHKGDDINTKTMGDKLTTNEYETFFDTTDINLLFDAYVVDIISLLKKAKAGTAILNVRSIINRELINDPAPKAYEDDESKINTKINVDIMFDAEEGNISYPAIKEIEPTDLQRDKFFSNYDFRMGPIKRLEKGLPTTNVDILSKDGKKVYANNDPHENNCIMRCWNRILEAFKISPMKHIDSSVHFQCKRSGDWLQALACLDMKRLYVGKSRVKGPLPGNKIILVTHDKVLLWFALFLGIDVLMTYKIAPVGAGAGAGDEEDDEVEGYGGDEQSSSHHVIYFSHTSRASNPKIRKIREEAIKKKAAECLKNMKMYKDYIEKYNGWISEIKEEREKEINSISTEESSVDKIEENLKKLIRAYWRFTALDYTKIEDKFEDIAKGKDPDEQLISYCNELDYKIANIQDKRSLEATEAAYNRDKLYKNPVDFTVVYRKPRGTLENVHSLQAVSTAAFLTERLSTDMVSQLVKTLVSIRAKLDGATLYILDIFLKNLPAVAAVAAASHITDEEHELVLASQIKEELRENNDGQKDVQGAAARPNNRSKAAADRTVEQEITEEAATLPDEPASGKRRIVNTIPSAGPAFRKQGFVLRRSNRGPAQLPERYRGGGNKDAFVFYFLYMRQLLHDLRSFESPLNGDYVYYDALAVCVLDCIKSLKDAPDFYNQLDAIFYQLLPGLTLGDCPIVHDDEFASNLAFVARQVALHSIDMASGEIPHIGEGSIPGKMGVIMLARLKGKTFLERQTILYRELQRYILNAPKDKENGGIGRVSITTGNTLKRREREWNKEIPRRTPIAARGGGKRRKQWKTKRRNR